MEPNLVCSWSQKTRWCEVLTKDPCTRWPLSMRHTHKLTQWCLAADWIIPRESVFVYACEVRSPLIGCQVRSRARFSIDRKMAWYFRDMSVRRRVRVCACKVTIYIYFTFVLLMPVFLSISRYITKERRWVIRLHNASPFQKHWLSNTILWLCPQTSTFITRSQNVYRKKRYLKNVVNSTSGPNPDKY